MSGPETTATGAIEADAFRASMARLAGAVHIVTTDGPGGRAGFTASAVCSVTDAPPTLLICMNRGASSHAIFARNGSLCVNTLCAGHEALASAFGGRVPAAERFALGQWRIGAALQPMLVGALVAFECRIAQRFTVGTHDVMVCEVVALAPAQDADALIYVDRHYHALPVGQTDSLLHPVGVRTELESPVTALRMPRRRAALRVV